MITKLNIFESTYNKFIHSRSKQIDETKAKAYLEELTVLYGYKDIKDLPYLYRATKFIGDYAMYNPLEYNRVSANTTNHYTLLMDNLPSWIDYPKRSKSLICSTKISNVYNYGLPYLIFAKPDTKLAICPKSDLWVSFNKLNDIGIESIDFLNFWLSGNNISDKSYDDLIDDIKSKELSLFHKGEYLKITLDDIVKLIDPILNNFKLIDFKDLNNFKIAAHECWFSAEALAIQVNTDLAQYLME